MAVNLAVLASGRGSNFKSILQAIEAGDLDSSVKILVTDRGNAGALRIAEEYDVNSKYIPYDRDNRRAFEEQAGDLIEENECDLIVMAGYMRVLTPYFIRRFENRILNIHPSLLPAFKGLHAQRQALEYGVKISGCTVHIASEDMDSGPIIAQRAVPVFDDDTEESLSERILGEEHKLYPIAIREYAEKLELI